MTQVSVLKADDLNAVAFIENRVVRFCAAHILGILERWTRWKQKKYQDAWIYMPVIRQEKSPQDIDGKSPTSWHGEMLGQFGKDAIRSALDILQDIGVVLRRKNPYNGQDKTYQYRLNTEVLEDLRSGVETEPNSEGDMPPMDGDCSPRSQRSNQFSTNLERGDLANFEEEVSEQDNQLQTRQKSRQEEEKVSEVRAPDRDLSAAAAPPVNFDELQQADLRQFEPPDQPGLLNEFFEWVLAHRVPGLKHPPADPASAACGWIRKYGKALVRGFIRWKGSIANAPPPTPPPPIEQCRKTPEETLRHYQAMWRDTHLRNAVRRAVSQNPALGITIGKDGPCWKEASC